MAELVEHYPLAKETGVIYGATYYTDGLSHTELPDAGDVFSFKAMVLPFPPEEDQDIRDVVSMLLPQYVIDSFCFRDQNHNSGFYVVAGAVLVNNATLTIQRGIQEFGYGKRSLLELSGPILHSNKRAHWLATEQDLDFAQIRENMIYTLRIRRTRMMSALFDPKTRVVLQ